ncbi:MAG: GTP-binding protein, partial [Prevotella sp.]|nr:GTP-binding protein [Prevotella sp.]
STLLNCLLHEEKAIVSNIHGTTRDVIEDTTEIKGITFRFIDTAGLRHTEDTIEQLGIERTYKKLNEATIILWVVEQSPTTEELKEMENHTQGKQLIIVKNKVDLNPQKEKVPPPIDIAISAKHQQNIHELEQYIFQAAHLPEINESSVILTNARHYEALTRADEMILRVIDGIESELSGDLISEDLRTCLNQLAEITGGQITPNEVLGNIFKHFCIGK